MKKIWLIPAAILFFALLLFWTNPSDRDLTVIISKKVHGQSMDKSNGIEFLLKHLKDYSSQDPLEGFVKENLEYSNFTIKAIGGKEKGYSGDQVYKVSQEGTPCKIILKTFLDTSDNFLNEIYSLNELNDLDVSAPHIEAIGRFNQDGNTYFVLAETCAPGESLYTIYTSGNQFDLLNSALYHVGKSLARLHNKRKSAPVSLDEGFDKRITQYLKGSLEVLNKNPVDCITAEDLQKIYDEVRGRVKSEKFRSAVLHGDTKMVNVFYDSRTKTVTWIDPPTLSRSIDASGNAVGLAGRDTYSLIADLKHWQVISEQTQGKTSEKILYTDPQINQLEQSFDRGYIAGGGTPPTSAELDYFTLGAHLYFLANPSTGDKFSYERRLRNIYYDYRNHFLPLYLNKRCQIPNPKE